MWTLLQVYHVNLSALQISIRIWNSLPKDTIYKSMVRQTELYRAAQDLY